MAAHSFYNQTSSSALTDHGNDRVTFMEMPLNETMNTVLIQMVCLAVAGSHHEGLYETLCFNSPGTLKIKGRVCVVSNESEIGMGR